jgi:phosphoglycolate phosphatase
LVQELSRITGIDQEALKASFKRVHEQYKTTEYSFAVEQLDVLAQAHQGLAMAELLERYDSAFHAFRRVRKNTLRLYEGVAETLSVLKGRGKILVAVTDSLRYYSEYRLRQLNIDSLFDVLVSPPDHGVPQGVRPSDVRYYEDEARYRSCVPVKITTPAGARKPDPVFINLVLDQFHIQPDEAIYIGDSATKDVLLAQACGVRDVLAEYGRQYDEHNYAELVKITYWTNAEIEEDMKLRARVIQPTWVINSFTEVLGIVTNLDAQGAEGPPFGSLG